MKTTIVSDVQVRAGVRAVLSKHWIDLRPLTIGVTRGVVRLRGELRHHGRLHDDPVRAEEVEQVDSELRHVRGVRSTHLHFENWRRDEGDRWTRVTTRTSDAEVPTVELDVDDYEHFQLSARLRLP